MSQPTTAINLNKTTPAAPGGQQNVVFQTDNGTPQAQVSAYDPLMVGDSGSGGKAGNAPAPAAGDAAANKFLKADGTWKTPPSITGTLGVTVDGSGGTPAAGLKGYIRLPFNCTITEWTIIADRSGSATFDIKYASSLSGIGSTTSITASSKPTLSSAQTANSATLTGWTTSFSAGNVLEFDLTTVSTVTRVTLQLTVLKS